MVRGTGSRCGGLVLGLLAGCVGAPEPDPITEPGLAAVARQLEGRGAATIDLPTTPEAVAALPPGAVLVVVGRAPDVPLWKGDATALVALRQWVDEGGRLLLLGYAARLAYELGFESRVPDRYQEYRWGYDHRALLGTYRFGFE